MLRVRLPEADADADSACAWCMTDAAGTVLRAGESPVSALPAASPVHLVAPASRVLLTQIALPRRRGRELRRMLSFAVEEKLAADPDDIHVALGAPQRNGLHAVAVVERAWLAGWLQAFAGAGMTPASMTAETCLIPFEDGAWTAVSRGTGGFVRTGLASGTALDDGRESAPPEILQLALEEARGKNAAPRALIVCAERGFPAPDLAAWTDSLRLPCTAAPPWDWRERSDPAQVELLQGEYAPAGRAREVLPRMRPALILLALAFGLHALGTAAHWAALRYEKESLRAQMHERFRASFPEAQAVVEPALQMRRQLDSLRRASGEAQADDLVLLLASAAPQLKGHAVKRLSYDQTKLSLDVETGDRAEAEALLRRLQGAGMAATIAALNPKGNGVEARIALAARKHR